MGDSAFHGVTTGGDGPHALMNRHPEHSAVVPQDAGAGIHHSPRAATGRKISAQHATGRLRALRTLMRR